MITAARGLAAAASVSRRRGRGMLAGPAVGAHPDIGAVRNLNLHEFPSMELMREHRINTPKGYVASDPEEAKALFHSNFISSKGTYSTCACVCVCVCVFVFRA